MNIWKNMHRTAVFALAASVWMSTPAAAAGSREKPAGRKAAGRAAAAQSPTGPVRAASVAESAEDAEGLAGHVSGIRDFSLIEGMNPDLTAGISWDDSVKNVAADASGADFTTAGSYPVTYTIQGADGTEARKTITATVRPDLEHYLYGMEGKVEIPLNGTFDPMEHLVWEDEISSVTADTSTLDTSKPGDYLITYTLTAPDGRQQKTVRQVTVTDGDAAESGTSSGVYSTVTDLGLWRLTAYMDTPADQGPYVGQTASGAPLTAGRTVAVSAATCSRLGLQFGDRLMIDGHIYVLEDHGGSPMENQNWVDIYVDNEADEYSDQFNRYSEVYLLR